ncbi:MAG: mechanosensitive ion channel [Alphaproteobacteria bacterium]|nr:mechanosensitive ion channel [Alphaproteobacteria bacterium]
MRMIHKLGIWLTAALLLSFTAQAQTNHIDDLGYNLSYKEISKSLKEIEAMTKAEKPDVKALVAKISYLNATLTSLSSSRESINGEIKLIEKRIEALGESSGESPEAKVIAQQRHEFNQELTTEKTRLSEIDVLSAKIEEINLRIFDIRNQRLWGNLLKLDLRFINPAVLWKANSELMVLLADIAKSPYAAYLEYKESGEQGAGAAIGKFLALLALITALGYYMRRFVITHWGYRSDIDNLRLGRKIAASVAVWCAYGIIPTAIIIYCWYHLSLIVFWNNAFFKLVLQTSLSYALFVTMGRAFARVILTPYNEKWRLINMSTEKAKRLFKAINFTIYTVGLFSILMAIVMLQHYSLELLSYLMALSASLRAICMVWLTYIYFMSDSDESAKNTKNAAEAATSAKNRASRIGVVVMLFVFCVISLAFLGYAQLAFFVVNRTLLSLAALFVYTILRRFIYDVGRRLLFMGLWVKNFHMRRIFLRKVDFWFGFAIEPLITLGFMALLLILWGMPTDVLQSIAYKAVYGFTVGGVKISLVSIFWGILAFVICLWIIRFLQDRIEFKILERTSIDAGTKHSLASGFAYIGYVLSGLLAIAIMGGNLSNIALIAGALSVGIGLGLQDIVNNFVSGIIMLFERPIKVGDWVIINGEEGQIKQINIRSTEIETFTRSSLIIPNSKVLSNAVTNLTHQNNWARYSVKVGVAYGSDVKKVEQILLDCALNHPKVVKKPAPYVLFKDFGSSSLDFEVRFYVNDIWKGWTTPSDIRFMINEKFIENNIEIPFSQIVVHQAQS